MSDQPGLWVVHTLGPDDLHPAASRRLAARNATWMNLTMVPALASLEEPHYPLSYSVPERWDGTPEEHAAGLAAEERDDHRWSDLTADVLGDLARELFVTTDGADA
jgi:predicted component of type VI protein secretion system